MTEPRKDFIALPSIEEIRRITEAEAWRAVAEAKLDSHFASFESIQNLLHHYDLPTAFFEGDRDFEELAKTNFIHEVNTSINLLEQKLLNDPNKPGALLNNVYEYLSEEDTLDKAELIFVFGAKTPARAEKAAEIYQSGLAEKICVSGGSPFYSQGNTVSEAETYANILIAKGVPENAILKEETSITIPDNVRKSLNFFDEQSLNFKSIILVNSPYVQRRGYVHFQKYTPSGTKLYRVNSSTIEKYSKDGWHTNPDGIHIIFNEFVKMKIATSLNTA